MKEEQKAQWGKKKGMLFIVSELQSDSQSNKLPF